MPIELEDLPPRKPYDVKPPRSLVWAIVLLVCALLGVAAAAFFWPQGQPTMTFNWWGWVAVYPLCAFAVLFGARLYVFDRPHNHIVKWNADHDEGLVAEIARGQQAIRLYRMAYATPLGLEGLAQKLADKESALATVPGANDEHVMCAAFKPDILDELTTKAQSNDEPTEDDYAEASAGMMSDEGEDAGRDGLAGQSVLKEATGHEGELQSPESAPVAAPAKLTAAELLPALYEHLLALHARALRSLPAHRLRVCLAFNEVLAALDPVAAWQSACAKTGLSLPEPEIMTDGLMALDRWLDKRHAGKPFPLTLVVSVTRFDAPPARGGDAAVAVLIGPDTNDKHLALPPIAWVRRPELLGRADNPAPLSLKYALRWSGQAPENLDQVWFSGVSQEAQAPLLSALPGIGLPPEGHPRVDISGALGNADVTSGWLALVAAIEHGQANGKAQYVVAADPKPVAMVVEPVLVVSEPADQPA